MKNIYSYVSALIVALNVTSFGLCEDTKSLSVDTSAAAYSDYMFRGIKLYEGVSFQPSLTANYKTDIGTFSGNLWMAIPGETGADSAKFTELDETIKYTYGFDVGTLVIGNIWYTYPSASDHLRSSEEVFVSMAFNNPLLNPVVSVYHDYNLTDAQYYELGISHNFEKLFEGSESVVTPFAAFGFGSNGEKVYADNGLEHVTFGTYMTIPVGAMSVVPSANFTAKVDDNTSNEFWFGTALNYSF